LASRSEKHELGQYALRGSNGDDRLDRSEDRLFGGKEARRLTVPKLLASAIGVLVSAGIAGTGLAQEPIESQIKALAPRLEAYVADGIKAFDNPGLVIGIVAGDRLVYAKGFGVRKKGGRPDDARTVFQLGSTTKAFLATTMAIGVDRGKFRWDDRIVDLDPDFQLKDPWVTRELRMFEIIAQRSGLPPYANDLLGMLGFDEAALIRSPPLRRSRLELPFDICLYQHHAPGGRPHCGKGRRSV